MQKSEHARAASAGSRLGPFLVKQHLGSGGFGDVYEVEDPRARRSLALKLLHRSEPRSLYRFKREFRALASVTHPNLVRLHELFVDAPPWFFTMDLVQGRPLLDGFRDGPSWAQASLETCSARTLSFSLTADPPRRPPPSGDVVVALRDQLGQLALGLRHLHAAGLIHRDVKPSNVLVKPSGHVVVLDFGLVADAGDPLVEVVGSPAYISPEVLAGEPASDASDWYAVGVMLYEALTGRSPYLGSASEVVRQKRVFEPVPPSRLRDGLPPDLEQLCTDLLARDPSARPGGQDVVAMLAPRRDPMVSVLAPPAERFVGRAPERRALEQAARGARMQPMVVLLRGEPGIGKTALVRKFLADERRRDPTAVVLTGRCHEQEQVRFKAFDALIDELSAWLRTLPEAEARAVVPRHARALGRLFPVLLQVPAVADAPEGVPADEATLRGRAIHALRDLFGRIAERRPLLLFIDDVQWSDADSAYLLAELLAPPEPPPLLVLCCRRSDGGPDDPMLLAARAREGGGAATVLDVGPLAPSDAQALARGLLGADTHARAGQLARASRGRPLLLLELCRAGSLRAEGVEQILLRRLEPLDVESRALVDAVCVAAGPLRLDVLERALGRRVDEKLGRLVDAAIVRTRASRGHTWVEPHHDRLREAVVAALRADATARWHRRLAEALAEDAVPDDEKLAIHWLGAGRPDRAAIHVERAAAAAAATLAFDRAARLYGTAGELCGDAPERRRQLLLRRADMLAADDRCEEAAAEYLRAAEDAPFLQAQDLQQRAAAQLMLFGDVERGMRLVEEVLARTGIRVPRSDAAAMAAGLACYAEAELRGPTRLSPRRSALTAVERIHIDACWQTCISAGMVRPAVGIFFQGKMLALAVRAGEPTRIVKGLALQVPYLAAALGQVPWLERRVADMTALAERLGDPYLRALVLMQTGWYRALQADWRDAIALLDDALQIFERECAGVPWELRGCRIPGQRALWFCGRLADMQARLPVLVHLARRQKNLFTSVYTLVESRAYLRLAADQPGEADELAREAIATWRSDAPHQARLVSELARGDIALYEEPAGPDAYRHVERMWHQLAAPSLIRLKRNQLESHHLRGRACLAAAASRHAGGSLRRRMLRLVRGDARTIERGGLPVGTALAELLRAGAARIEGRDHDALRHLQRALRVLSSQGWALYEAVARLRYGELLGGSRGGELARQGTQALVAMGVASPRRFAEMIAPGT